MLWAHATPNGPIVAAWNGALLTAAVGLAVASATVRLDAAIRFTAPPTAVTNTVATTTCLACALREAARICATVCFAQSTSLPETFTTSHSASRFPTVGTAPSKANLLLGAVWVGTGKAATVCKAVSPSLVVLVAPTTRAALARAAVLLASTAIESPIATAFTLASPTTSMQLTSTSTHTGRCAALHITLLAAPVSYTKAATFVLLATALYFAEVATTVRFALALSSVKFLASFHLATCSSSMATAQSIANGLLSAAIRRTLSSSSMG